MASTGCPPLRVQNHRSQRAALILFAILALSLVGAACRSADNASHPAAAQAGSEIGAFDAVWQRTDAPVADGSVARTWIWGPAATAIETTEAYADAPGGRRTVRYYDKSRMELTDPEGDPESPWYITNGLLVVELMSGQRQLGDDVFEGRSPATMPVAGDANSTTAPTYATLSQLANLPARDDNAAVTEIVDRTGTVTNDMSLAQFGVVAAHLVSVPGIDHQVASVFWDFMNSSGEVLVDETLEHDLLFRSPFFATGYPLTEAYWIHVQIGGEERLVLFQAFERRVLTYTPDNSEGWRVESGNVGQHYYAWLYGSQPSPTPSPTTTVPPQPGPTETPTATVPINPTPTTVSNPPAEAELVIVGEGAVDAWMRSVVRDAEDRLWIVAVDNNQPVDGGTRPGRLVMYRATTPGIPVAFDLVPAGVVESADPAGDVNFADAALDAEFNLHIVWVDRGQAGVPLMYGVFDLEEETWSVSGAKLDDTNLAGFGGNAGQGGVSIAVNELGQVRVAYIAAGNQTQIRVRERIEGIWSEPVEPLRRDAAFVWHPVLVVDADDAWHLAGYDSTANEILASSDSGQGWTPAAIVASNVLGPENIDQGPAMLVTPDGQPYVLFVDSGSFLRLRVLQDGTWKDVDLGGDYFTHAPGIGLFADGTLVISGHDEFHPPHGMNILFGDASGWSAWEQLVALEADGSAVFRWAGAFAAPSHEYVDLVFFDEDLNNDGAFDDQYLYYVAVPQPSSQ